MAMMMTMKMKRMRKMMTMRKKANHKKKKKKKKMKMKKSEETGEHKGHSGRDPAAVLPKHLDDDGLDAKRCREAGKVGGMRGSGVHLLAIKKQKLAVCVDYYYCCCNEHKRPRDWTQGKRN